MAIVISRTVAQLIAGARQKSNTVFNQIITDDELTDRLAEGLTELNDLLTASNEHYQFRECTFDLQNGLPNQGLNQIDLTIVAPDFYKEISLDRVIPGGTRNETVTRFNILERNIVRNRRFEILGDILQVNPASIAQGTYIFRYVPLPMVLRQPTAITIKTTSTADNVSAGRSFSINTGLDAVLGAPLNQWDFANASFVQGDVGALMVISGQSAANNNGSFSIKTVTNAALASTDGLTVTAGPLAAGAVKISSVPAQSSATWTFYNFTFDSSYVGMDLIVSGCANPSNNGTFTITDVVGQHIVRTTSGQNISESFDGVVSVSIQVPGTIYKLPQIYLPWYEYLECRAARDILQKREQSTAEVDQRMAELAGRIQSLAAIRTEDGGQVPMQDYASNNWFDGDWLGFSN